MVVILPDTIMLYSLEGEGANPKYFEKVDIGGASTLHALWIALKTNNALKWLFDFWDAKKKTVRV